jgi:hypothetical protein
MTRVVNSRDEEISVIPYDLLIKYSPLAQALGLTETSQLDIVDDFIAEEFDASTKYIQLYDKFKQFLNLCEEQDKLDKWTLTLTPNIFWSFHLLLQKYSHEGKAVINFLQYPIYMVEHADYVATLTKPKTFIELFHKRSHTVTEVCSNIDFFTYYQNNSYNSYTTEEKVIRFYVNNGPLEKRFTSLWSRFTELVDKIDSCTEKVTFVNYNEYTALLKQLMTAWNDVSSVAMQWGEDDNNMFIEQYSPCEYQMVFDKLENVRKLIGLPSCYKLFAEHVNELETQKGEFKPTTRLSVKLLNEHFFYSY